jgi:hypothetical protein
MLMATQHLIRPALVCACDDGGGGGDDHHQLLLLLLLLLLLQSPLVWQGPLKPPMPLPKTHC